MLLILQTRHVYSALKWRGNDRLVKSTRGVFVGNGIKQFFNFIRFG